jgi:uncharacterized protein DUF3551
MLSKKDFGGVRKRRLIQETPGMSNSRTGLRGVGGGDMRLFLVALATSIAPMMFADRAHTLPYDPYQWCAVYGGSMNGSSNCGFTTWQQCMATVSGIGGSCEPNQFYNLRRPVSRSKASKKRRDYQPYRDQPAAPFYGTSSSWPSYFFGD